jgi:SAM-dependent methyltransferase
MEIDRDLVVRALVAMNTGLSRPHMQAMVEAILAPDGLYDGVPLGRSANSHFIEMMGFVSRLSETELSPGARVLDVGCGEGRLLAALRKAFGIEAHGVDKSLYIGSEDRSKSVDVIRALWSAHNKSGLRILSPFNVEEYPLPYTDEYFDTVMFKNAFDDLGGAAKSVIDEIFRVIRPGGIFLIDRPNRGDINVGELRAMLKGGGFGYIRMETTTYLRGDGALVPEDISTEDTSIITAYKP